MKSWNTTDAQAMARIITDSHIALERDDERLVKRALEEPESVYDLHRLNLLCWFVEGYSMGWESEHRATSVAMNDAIAPARALGVTWSGQWLNATREIVKALAQRTADLEAARGVNEQLPIALKRVDEHRAELAAFAARVVAGFKAWAADEDGVHYQAWDTYQEARRLAGLEPAEEEA